MAIILVERYFDFAFALAFDLPGYIYATKRCEILTEANIETVEKKPLEMQ